MRSLTSLIALCLLASCQNKKEDPKTPPPAGESIPDLPTAIHSRTLESSEASLIELVVSQNQSNLFHRGKQIVSTSSEEDLFSGIQNIRKINNGWGVTTPLLLSASGTTPFGTIRDRIRTAAKAGIHQILFLVRSEKNPTPAVVVIELTTTGDQLPKIEPYFLHIDADGQVFSGTGAGRIRMDSGNDDHHLKMLTGHLELLSASAKSAGSPAFCQIYVDPKATYQRAIDLISLANMHDIRLFFTDLLPEPETKPAGRPQRKPSPPSSGQVKPLGLAPKK